MYVAKTDESKAVKVAKDFMGDNKVRIRVLGMF